MAGSELLARANFAMAKKDFARAANFQYWYVQKSKTGLYDFACLLAQEGQVDPALYWLQLAATEEGVDAAHAERDTDLRSLRVDPRWGKISQYLNECNRYFELVPIARTVLVLPKGYRTGKPIPAILWLHGFGSNPEDFANSGCQKFADGLNVAIIGVSATIARGPRSFVWSDDIDKNAKRLRDALAELSDRVNIQTGKVITLGFSQGAQVGLEAAVREPEKYAGAIALSPGARTHLKGLNPSPLMAGRRFVVSCGADELIGNVQLTAYDADWLHWAKAEVILKVYPGVSSHAFPRDFNERFPEWVEFILKSAN